MNSRHTAKPATAQKAAMTRVRDGCTAASGPGSPDCRTCTSSGRCAHGTPRQSRASQRVLRKKEETQSRDSSPGLRVRKPDIGFTSDTHGRAMSVCRSLPTPISNLVTLLIGNAKKTFLVCWPTQIYFGNFKKIYIKIILFNNGFGWWLGWLD